MMEDYYDKIMKCILSCKHDDHFKPCDLLIKLFHDMFKNQNLTDNLKAVRQSTWLKIHEILV